MDSVRIFLLTGPRVKSKAITFRNIQQFVPIILKNKVFLMGDSEDERYIATPIVSCQLPKINYCQDIIEIPLVGLLTNSKTFICW